MIDLIETPLNITAHIIKFRDFLNASWSSVDHLIENHDWDNDGSFLINWVQVNWEFFMERSLLEGKVFLPPLEWSKRITSSNSSASHKIICVVHDKDLYMNLSAKLQYQDEELHLQGFCTPYESSFGMYPPFDYINTHTLDQKKLYTLSLTKCHFFLKRKTPGKG